MAAAAAAGADQRAALLGDAGEQESWSHALDVEPPPAEGPSVQVPGGCSRAVCEQPQLRRLLVAVWCSRHLTRTHKPAAPQRAPS